MTKQPRIDKFNTTRTKYNKVLAKYANRTAKKFYGIDADAYGPSDALTVKTKHLLGLATSIVLRCDDCILYHLIECHKAGATSAEIQETFSICMLVGGSICIPHLRRAMDIWDKELT